MMMFEPDPVVVFERPEQMARILEHLKGNGRLNIGDATVQHMYGKFSEEAYCAGWVNVDSDPEDCDRYLCEFADWLAGMRV
jgi:hypothetical protein